MAGLCLSQDLTLVRRCILCIPPFLPLRLYYFRLIHIFSQNRILLIEWANI
jgi:hypothetical protein